MWKEVFVFPLQDVERTNPNLSLCKKSHYQHMMCVLLFVYAKEHPDMAYKQGMHEILAVLLTVQHGCCQDFSRVYDPRSYDACCRSSAAASAGASSASPFRTECKRLVLQFNDPAYLEHDVYFLFETFMENMWEWYYVPPPPPTPSESGDRGGGRTVAERMQQTRMLSPPAETGPK